MIPKYYRQDILVNTLCEHCGAQCRETLGQLYSYTKLACPECGLEHTTDRDEFRRMINETEAFIDKMSEWPIKAIRKW